MSPGVLRWPPSPGHEQEGAPAGTMRLCQRFPPPPQRPSARAVGAVLSSAAFLITSAGLGADPPSVTAAAGRPLRQAVAASPAPGIAAPGEQGRALQRGFDSDRSRLGDLVNELRLGQVRLARFEASEQHGERALALRLVVAYESGRTHVAAGGADLVAGVRAGRAAVAAEAIQLGALSLRRSQLTEQVLEERARPVDTRTALAGGGVDLAAPWDTPELAVCAGTVVLHGVGGLGPWTPVLHCDSPIAGHDYFDYGHAGPGHWTPVGAHVARGQAISEVGPGIVGDSTGPDLEIGFADASGSPTGSAGAQYTMSLLRSAYRS